MADYIKLRGACLHNLKNLDADFPLGKITVVCGPSGCGKSTLVLDTLHGESKRRYLETLSPFAADLLGGKRNIPLNSTEGLPASIAIGPTHGEANSKAYALSIAECDHGLQTLFATYGTPACPVCGEAMESTAREEIIRHIAGKPEGTKLQFLAKMEPGKNDLDKLSAVFLAQGFTRAMADGVSYSLADLTPAEKKIQPQEFYIVVDRIIVRENTRTRIAEAVDGTLKLTHSLVTLDVAGTTEIYSTAPRCKNEGDKKHAKKSRAVVPNLEARSFSPYNKICACTSCNGTGGDETGGNCEKCGGLRLKPEILNAVVSGVAGQNLTEEKNRAGVSWKTILNTPFQELPKILHSIFDDKIGTRFAPTFNALLDRIDAICELGIGYLTSGRSGQSLSGGELQRLKLSSLSTGFLNGLLVCLDEPASGLHSSDVEKLWKVLKKIQSRGNTLVLIEHHPEIIRRADYIIEMGPGAGEKGGEILFQGPREKVLENAESPTGCWIKKLADSRKQGSVGKKSVASNNLTASNNRTAGNNCAANKSRDTHSIAIQDFCLYDMAKVSANFPLQKFSVITGQSGSGKSTLLFENIAKRAEQGEFATLGIEALSILTTGDFHGSKRSTVCSAIGLSNLLRDLFAKLPESKVRGWNATKFSTHTPGGRCENCKGEGTLFDPSGYEESECPVCQGRRFREEVLEVRFKSLSIADILDMEVGKAYKLFTNLKPFADKLKPLVDTGLDYLRLGQTTAHLSGGERARLRLSIALARAKAPNTLFLFDEPARGLHEKDILHLLDLIRDLTTAGHTVIAIEHAQDFVNAADYVLELHRNS
ncbi:MAG: ABC transporter [Fibrobacter sp.]|nr:ABC transporter [Fibrobacter sp.]